MSFFTIQNWHCSFLAVVPHPTDLTCGHMNKYVVPCINSVYIVFYWHVFQWGLNDFEKISNCDYFDWYCNCNINYNIRGNDNIYMIIHFFIEKTLKWIKIKMIVAWLFAGMCGSVHFCSISIFNSKWYFDTFCLW